MLVEVNQRALHFMPRWTFDVRPQGGAVNRAAAAGSSWHAETSQKPSSANGRNRVLPAVEEDISALDLVIVGYTVTDYSNAVNVYFHFLVAVIQIGKNSRP
jgi:hypothetical protein